MLPPAAGAGTYDVAACRSSPGQTGAGGWTSANPRPVAIEVGNGCAPGAATHAGLFARDILYTVEDARANEFFGWRFTAPPGTTVAAIDYDAFTHIQYDEDWTVGLRVADGPGAGQYDDCHVPFGTEDCTTGSARRRCPAHPRAAWRATALAFGAWCEPLPGNSVCSAGNENMDAVLYAATVTLNDPTPPSASPPTATAITNAAWVRGTTPIGVAGSDGQLGVRRLLLARDGGNLLVDYHSLACTADPVPCPLGQQSHSFDVDTTTFPDGPQTIVGRATDGASNVTDSTGVTLRVDNTPPEAPAAASDAQWSQSTDGSLDVPVGAEQNRAPITTVRVSRCPPGGGACTLSDVPAGTPGTTQTIPITSLPEGETTVRAALIDAAGNVGTQSTPVSLRRDRTPPDLSVEGTSAPIAEGDPIPAPPTTARDPLSGVQAITHEIAINGGPFTALTTQRARAGETYRFRARAQDTAGNVSPWVLADGERATVAASAPGGPAPAPPPTAPSQPADTTASQRPASGATHRARTHVRARAFGRPAEPVAHPHRNVDGAPGFPRTRYRSPFAGPPPRGHDESASGSSRDDESSSGPWRSSRALVAAAQPGRQQRPSGQHRAVDRARAGLDRQGLAPGGADRRSPQTHRPGRTAPSPGSARA